MNRYISLLLTLILLTSMLSGCFFASGLQLDSQPSVTLDTQVPTTNTQVPTTNAQVQITVPTIPEETEYLRDLIDLPKDVQIMIVGEEKYNSDAYQESLRSGKRSRTVYGEFDGVYVLFPIMWATMAPYVETVNGLQFCYGSSRSLHAYTKDGRFTLTEAFEKGILTAEQLQEVYDNYYYVKEQKQ